MKKIVNVTTTVMLIMLLGLAGCNNIFSPNSGSSGIEDGKGLVRLQFSAGRTLLPTTFNFESFKLTFTPEEEEGEAVVVTDEDQELDEGIKLAAGDWTLDVEIFAEETKIALAKDIAVTIVSNQVANVLVNLEFDITEGEGTFTWDIDLEDFEGEAELTLTLLSGDPEIDPIDLLDEEANFEELELSAGYYLVTVTLKGETTQAVWANILHIYPSQVTGLTLELGDFDFYGEEIEEVPITFDAGEGKFIGGEGSGTTTRTVTIDKGDVVAIPADVALDGHLFVEWNTKADGTGTKLTADITHDADTTYYAIWEEVTFVFTLADWFTANPDITAFSGDTTGGASGNPIPFSRSSSGTLTTIVEEAGKKSINIRYQQGIEGGGTLSGNTHGLNIHIDSTGLDLKPNDYFYEIHVVGNVVGTPPANQTIRLRNRSGTVTYGTSDVLEGENTQFVITSMFPTTTVAPDVIRIQLEPAIASGSELHIRIENILIIERGQVPQIGDVTIDLTVEDKGAGLDIVDGIPATRPEISKSGETKTLTFTVKDPEEGFPYTWYVDGKTQLNDESITIDAADYDVGDHSVRLVVEDKDGKFWSLPTMLGFRVVE